MMKTLIITRLDYFEGETTLVNELFRLGMERLHLRKPSSTKEEMAEWIDQIDLPFRHLIVLHDHHELAQRFEVGGIHLNSRNPEPPQWAIDLQKEGHFTLSRSCHSLAEIRQHLPHCDYLFLSPIYDSISKEGYGAAFSREELFEANAQGLLKEKVYALGGVSLEHLPEVQSMGFAGAAILGDLWRKSGDRVSANLCLDQLQKILMQARILG